MKALLLSSSSSSVRRCCSRSRTASFCPTSSRACIRCRSASSRAASISLLSRDTSDCCTSSAACRSRCCLSEASRACCSRRSAASQAARNSLICRSLSSAAASSPASAACPMPARDEGGPPSGLASPPSSVAPPPWIRCFSICAFSRATWVNCSRISSRRLSDSCLAATASSNSRALPITCSRAIALMLAIDWLCRSSSATQRCCRASKAPEPSPGPPKTWATASSPGKTSSMNCWKTRRSSVAASKAPRQAARPRSSASRLTGLSCAAASSKTPPLSGSSSPQRRWKDERSSIRIRLKRTTFT
mmetsp:Transcript_31258/g.89645  ORF Transcript_31258/g.89645 Transcript_31258/m.89645 type:complete len:304 (-) Transcript_31258:283-1194(-)